MLTEAETIEKGKRRSSHERTLRRDVTELGDPAEIETTAMRGAALSAQRKREGYGEWGAKIPGKTARRPGKSLTRCSDDIHS